MKILVRLDGWSPSRWRPRPARPSTPGRPHPLPPARPAIALLILTVLSLLGIETATGAATSAPKVFITEIMAANTRTLLDRDREYSDWIELFNAGSDAVNLDGWALTDDRNNLQLWKFPGVTLGPSEYVVVFASGKNRRVAGSELHTNFKLSADGEYLALVQPDGKTVAMEFAPRYPAQAADASYGLAMSNPGRVLVPESAPKKVFVPTNDIGMNWLTPGFNDSAWLATSNGIGFDARGTYNSRLGADLGPQMQGRGSSAYVRIPFTTASGSLESLKLRVRYDDGFVAYLNGWEVARANAPTPARWDSIATAEHGSAVPVIQGERFDGPGGRFWTGQATPAMRPREHPRSPGSQERHLRLVNGQIANQVNSVAFPAPNFSTSDSAAIDLDYRFSGTGEGTERLGILLIPTSAHGTEGPGIRLEALQNVRDPSLPGVFAVQLLHTPDNGQNALTIHWDGNRRTSIDVPTAGFRSRAFHHARIEITRSGDSAQARVVLTADRNAATATATATLPGFKLAEQRLQLIGRIGHWDQTIDVDDVYFQVAGAAGLVGEEFDLTPHLSALKEGPNLLGFHALNRSATDGALFLQPELLAGMGSVRTNQALHLAEPTPGAANRDGHAEVAPPPVFVTKPGVFKDNIEVELAVKEGTIRYTLDGTDPTASSPEYSRPIPITRSTLVKARTFAPNRAPSGVRTETFTLVDPDQTAFSSNLPLVIINSFGRYISANNKTPVSIRLIETQAAKGGKGDRATLLDSGNFDGRALVNLRGYSTLRQPKNSMTIRLRDENGDRLKSSLLGLPKESDWVLYAPYSDKTMIRDALAYEMSNAMGRYAPRTRFVEVYIDRSGGRLGRNDYAGVYLLVERIRTGKNRLDMATVGPDDNREPAISGGYLFKRDHSERYEPSFRTPGGNRFFYVEPDGNEITREQSAWLTRYVSQFEQALEGPGFRDPDKGYARYLDVDAFIDQHWLIEGTKNIDGFRYSAYVHKPRDGKLTVGPAWDWNLSFGNADYHDGYDPKGWYTEMLRDTEIAWFRRLSEDPEFMQRTIDRWAELRRSVFSKTRLHRRIDEMAAQLNEAQARNFSRWPILGRSVNPNYFVGRTYQEEIDWMKDWISRRIEWIDSQFPRTPSIKPAANGAISVSAAGSGQIYITTDGSDPRAPGGQPSAKAQAYKSPVSPGNDHPVKARVKRGDLWSGLASTKDTAE